MHNSLQLSILVILTGFCLDTILGDPPSFRFHIVRLCGSIVIIFERCIRKLISANPFYEILGGAILVSVVLIVSGAIPLLIITLIYRYSVFIGFVFEAFLMWQLIAAKSLKTESMSVYSALVRGELEVARQRLSMIVGRDTSVLEEDGMVRACVETVAENASDAVVAPLFYTALGGVAAGCVYKAINTMDSILGYKNEKYFYFGRVAARLDDLANLLPSRICAITMIAVSGFLGYDSKGAFMIWRRDRLKHASPNSAQSEAACAGALGIELGGPSVYFGKVYDKPYIGDKTREIDLKDIVDANRLMYATTGAVVAMSVALRIVLVIFTNYLFSK